MENEILNVKLILPKEEASYLSEHKIIVAPFFVSKRLSVGNVEKII